MMCLSVMAKRPSLPKATAPAAKFSLAPHPRSKNCPAGEPSRFVRKGAGLTKHTKTHAGLPAMPPSSLSLLRRSPSPSPLDLFMETRERSTSTFDGDSAFAILQKAVAMGAGSGEETTSAAAPKCAIPLDDSDSEVQVVSPPANTGYVKRANATVLESWREGRMVEVRRKIAEMRRERGTGLPPRQQQDDQGQQQQCPSSFASSTRTTDELQLSTITAEASTRAPRTTPELQGEGCHNKDDDENDSNDAGWMEHLEDLFTESPPSQQQAPSATAAAAPVGPEEGEWIENLFDEESSATTTAATSPPAASVDCQRTEYDESAGGGDIIMPMALTDSSPMNEDAASFLSSIF